MCFVYLVRVTRDNKHVMYVTMESLVWLVCHCRRGLERAPCPGNVEEVRNENSVTTWPCWRCLNDRLLKKWEYFGSQSASVTMAMLSRWDQQNSISKPHWSVLYVSRDMALPTKESLKDSSKALVTRYFVNFLRFLTDGYNLQVIPLFAIVLRKRLICRLLCQGPIIHYSWHHERDLEQDICHHLIPPSQVYR